MPNLDQYFDEAFDSDAVPASTGRPEPLDPGKYTLQVEKGEFVHTKAGTGVMWKATMTVVTGPRTGAVVYTQFNVRNPSAQAQTIGVSEMKALAAACGVSWDKAKDETDNLLFKPFDAELGMESERVNPQTGLPYPPRNRISKYFVKGAPITGAAVAGATKRPAPAMTSVAPDDPPF